MDCGSKKNLLKNALEEKVALLELLCKSLQNS